MSCFKSGVSVTFHVHLLHPDGFALHRRSRDFFRFAIFLLHTGDSPAGSTLLPPVSVLTCPKLKRRESAYTKSTVCPVDASPREKCKNVF